MVLKRYLIYFSYIGTSFRGIQRQIKETEDPNTVQGLMDSALERMNVKNKPFTYIASRTDRGVHALKSALTVDLEFVHESDAVPFHIHHFLNRFFNQTDVPIRVNDVLLVSKYFNCRKSPLLRQYVYRFAILKPNQFPEDVIYTPNTLPIPVPELNRCYFVMDTKFDREAVKATTDVFVGPQDFISFLGKPNSGMHDENLLTWRYLRRVSLEPADPYIPSSLNNFFDYYHLICEGRSFIYNQVRNMVAVLLAVGQGKLTIGCVQRMFTDPTPNSWPTFLETAPPHGLYLTDIVYDPIDIAVPKNEADGIETPSETLERRKLNLKKRLETKSMEVKSKSPSNI